MQGIRGASTGLGVRWRSFNDHGGILMSAKGAGDDDVRDSDEAEATSGAGSKLRKSGAIGLGAAVVASALLMLATFALAISPTAYYGGGGCGYGGGRGGGGGGRRETAGGRCTGRRCHREAGGHRDGERQRHGHVRGRWAEARLERAVLDRLDADGARHDHRE